MNVKFHKNCDYTGKILKISCVRSNSVKFDSNSGFRVLYYYMRNFCNLIGLEQWYFNLI